MILGILITKINFFYLNLDNFGKIIVIKFKQLTIKFDSKS
jgi:hypothetical protein